MYFFVSLFRNSEYNIYYNNCLLIYSTINFVAPVSKKINKMWIENKNWKKYDQNHCAYNVEIVVF